MEKIKLDIEDSIADTLYITLYAKAVETKKKNPLITDTTACKLVDQLDYDFSKYKGKKSSIVGVAIRAKHFDEMVKKFIEEHDHPIVVSVGCGLDTRKQRLGKAGDKAIFYALDIDEVIEARRKILPPEKNQFYIASSMHTTEWMDELITKHLNSDFIFVIEGVLMYFNEAVNRFVFTELAKRFSGAEIHFDMLNKWMSRQTKMHDTVSKTNAQFSFGIDDEKEIERWHPHLKHHRTYLFNEFKGWRRMGIILSILMSIIPRFKTSSRLFIYKVQF